MYIGAPVLRVVLRPNRLLLPQLLSGFGREARPLLLLLGQRSRAAAADMLENYLEAEVTTTGSQSSKKIPDILALFFSS